MFGLGGKVKPDVLPVTNIDLFFKTTLQNMYDDVSCESVRVHRSIRTAGIPEGALRFDLLCFNGQVLLL